MAEWKRNQLVFPISILQQCTTSTPNYEHCCKKFTWSLISPALVFLQGLGGEISQKNNEGETASLICFKQIFFGLAQLKTQNTESVSTLACFSLPSLFVTGINNTQKDSHTFAGSQPWTVPSPGAASERWFHLPQQISVMSHHHRRIWGVWLFSSTVTAHFTT